MKSDIRLDLSSDLSRSQTGSAAALLVFDFDGTLIDSATDIHAAANRLMERHGFSPFTGAEARSFISDVAPQCSPVKPKAARPRAESRR